MYHIFYSSYIGCYYFIDLFFISHLQNKSYKKTALYSLAAVVILYSIITPFLYDLSVNRGLISILNYILLALPAFFLHLKINEAVKQGIGAILYMMIIEMISSIPTLIILSICKVQVSNVVELYLSQNILLLPIMISSLIIMGLLTYITLKLFTLNRIHTIFTYLFTPGIILLVLILINGFTETISYSFVLQCTTYVITFIINIALLYLYNKQLKNYSKLKAENKNSKLIQESQSKYIDEINKYYKTIRKEDHDFNNHLQIINRLIKEQSYNDAIDYINRLLENGGTL